jgi:surface polysaccharide O-acyltransferase-like enzyme
MPSVDLSEAVKLITLCLMAACLGHFFQYTLRPREIFGRYGLFLNYLWIKWRRKPDRWKRKLLKPIGLCIYCTTTWIFIVLYLFQAGLDSYSIHNLIGLFLGMGITYVWVEILTKTTK